MTRSHFGEFLRGKSGSIMKSCIFHPLQKCQRLSMSIIARMQTFRTLVQDEDCWHFPPHLSRLFILSFEIETDLNCREVKL